MINAWLVVREEKHIDTKFWVRLNREEALKIAKDVSAYWAKAYDLKNRTGIDVDKTCYLEQIFHYHAEDAFRVYVQPQPILEPGEGEP